MKKQTLASSLLLAALLAGCSMIPDYARPDLSVPAGWSEQHGAQATPTAIAKDWWTSFNSPELDALMDEALANNNDLGAAMQRVEQARATLRRSRASLLPSVDGTGSATYVNREVEDGPDTSDTGGSLGLAVAYELDLFGQNRAEIESGKATLESQSFARDATALIVMADVARGYFNVLNLQERLLIADQNLESARQLLRIVQARYDAGATTLLDVAQQKSDLASTEAARALVEQELAIARSSLAILLGRPPQNFGLKEKDLRGLVIPAIAPAQPSTLLERRPDIRSKEYELIAANADIGAARAAFFPSITLGLDTSLSVVSFGDPATTALSIGPSVLAPIFKGGLLEGNLLFSKARQKELAEVYQQTVLTAFKDVEDAMTTVRTSQKRETALFTAMTEARTAYTLSSQQYDAGAIDFQTLLDARQTLLRAEDAYIQTRNDRLAAAVDLFKALGGGWADKVVEPAAAKTATPPAPTPAPAPVATPPAKAQ